MSSAAQVRQILASLPEASALRIADTLAPVGPALSTGLGELDALTGGGLPRGRIAEMVGPCRTGLALAIAAAVTRRGEVIAWIDMEDALDPASLAAAGADLGRVLWVRPPVVRSGLAAADAVLDAGGFALVVLDFGDGPARLARAVPDGRGGGAARPSSKRISDSSWTRLQHRAERSETTLLCTAGVEIARSHSVLTLEVARERAVLEGRPALLERLEARVSLARCRFRSPGVATAVCLRAPDLEAAAALAGVSSDPDGPASEAPIPVPAVRARRPRGRSRPITPNPVALPEP